jgi:hypothetical protein
VTVTQQLRWRKKPVVIQAMRVPDPGTHDTEWDELGDFMEDCPDWVFCQDYVVIGTLEGEMRANIGDWIIKGVKGEYYPCKNDIFEATYEPA